MLICGHQIRIVLNGNGVAVFVAPSGIDYRSVQTCFYHAVGRGGDIHCGMCGEVESVGDDSYQRSEKMYSLYRKVPFGSRRKAELLLFLDLSTEYGILLLKVVDVLLFKIRDYVGIVRYFFQGKGLFSAQRTVDVDGIKFPAYHGALQGVDLDGVVECLAAEIGIRITRDGVVERREDQNGINGSDNDAQQQRYRGEKPNLLNFIAYISSWVALSANVSLNSLFSVS